MIGRRILVTASMTAGLAIRRDSTLLESRFGVRVLKRRGGARTFGLLVNALVTIAGVRLGSSSTVLLLCVGKVRRSNNLLVPVPTEVGCS